MASSRTTEIAHLHDMFRRGDSSVPGQRFVTAGVVHLLKQLDVPMETLIQWVAQLDDFTEHNDPHAQHDFGTFEFHGHQLFWKIDAYDVHYSMGSDDPTDLSKTRRVLTIMLAEEWRSDPVRTYRNFREESFGENFPGNHLCEWRKKPDLIKFSRFVDIGSTCGEGL